MEKPLDIESYEVFSGVTIKFINAHSSSCQMDGKNGHYLEIIHSLEGRAEWESDSTFYFLTSGDISISAKRDESSALSFPLSHFHGLMIVFDLDRAPKCFSCILEEVSVKPSEIAARFSPDNKPYIARSDEHIAHLFSELYDKDDQFRIAYYKVKILELLLFLSLFKETKDIYSTASKREVELANSISSYLSSHLEERVTLETLSRMFSSSPTAIKNAFRKVYGIPLYSFSKKVRMEEAAKRIRESDDNILSIASEFGYENGSKFASAFKSVLGYSPSEYRNVFSEPKSV